MSAPQTEHDELVARLKETGGCAMLPAELDGPAEVLAKSWECPKEAIIAGMRVALAWRPQTERGQDDLVARLNDFVGEVDEFQIECLDKRWRNDHAALLREAAAALKSPSPSVERATIERCAKVADEMAEHTPTEPASWHMHQVAPALRALRPTSGDIQHLTRDEQAMMTRALHRSATRVASGDEPQTDGERDATRYRWLRACSDGDWYAMNGYRQDRGADELDAQIDAALSRDTKRAGE